MTKKVKQNEKTKEFVPIERARENPWEKTRNETEINNLPDKEFKELVIKMLTEVWKRIHEHNENFNKELENIKKYQSELKNTITEMKNILKGINSRLGDTEDCISDLEGKIMEIIQSEQQKEKQI